jgi:hypothetical protein
MSDGDYDGGSFAADIFGYLCGYAHLTKLPQSILKKPSRHPCQFAAIIAILLLAFASDWFHVPGIVDGDVHATRFWRWRHQQPAQPRRRRSHPVQGVIFITGSSTGFGSPRRKTTVDRWKLLQRRESSKRPSSPVPGGGTQSPLPFASPPSS